MISASNLQPPDHDGKEIEANQPTTVLILPAFTFVDSVTQTDVPNLVHQFIDSTPDADNKGTGGKNQVKPDLQKHSYHIQ